MGLRHGVVDGDEMLVLHIFDGQRMVFVRLFRLQRRERDAATADHRISQCVDGIAADGADVELAAQHIGGNVFVADLLAVHQLDDGDPQCLSQRLQQADVWQPFGSLPLGNGLAADADALCQFCLGHIPALAQLPDGASGHISVHSYPVLSASSIP